MPLIDLSHPMADGQPAFPGDPALSIEIHCDTLMPGRCNVSKVTFSSHHGTHLDAMYHFVDAGKTLDQMPLDWFYGPTRVLRIPKAAREPIMVADFLPFEAALTPGAKVIYETGWHRHYGQPEYFEAFPTLTVEAAQFLADKGIRLLGMDTPTPSVDSYTVHHILLGRDIVIVESLANLDQVPDEFTFMGFPLNLKGRDGSPVRAVGLV